MNSGLRLLHYIINTYKYFIRNIFIYQIVKHVKNNNPATGNYIIKDFKCKSKDTKKRFLVSLVRVTDLVFLVSARFVHSPASSIACQHQQRQHKDLIRNVIIFISLIVIIIVGLNY